MSMCVVKVIKRESLKQLGLNVPIKTCDPIVLLCLRFIG